MKSSNYGPFQPGTQLAVRGPATLWTARYGTDLLRRDLPPGRAATRDGCDRGQPRQCQHAGLQGQPHAVQRLAGLADRHEPPRGERQVAFTQDRATYREQTAGTLQHTGNPLDVAISGDGYFTVDTPRGPRLTRAGRFTPQADGTIGDGDGNPVLDGAGQKLRLAPGDTQVTITADGTISSESGQIGRIGVVQPADPNRLTAEGARLLKADADTAPVPRRSWCKARSRTATCSRSSRPRG